MMAFVACLSANAAKIENGVLYLYGAGHTNNTSSTTQNEAKLGANQISITTDGTTVTKIVLDGDFSAGWDGGILRGGDETVIGNSVTFFKSNDRNRLVPSQFCECK